MTELRGRGIQPDAIVLRSADPVGEALKRKISNLCDVELTAVANAMDADHLYEIPLMLHEEGLDDYLCEMLGFGDVPLDLSEWNELVERVERADVPVRIGIVGKYVSLPDAYLSLAESLRHGGYHHGAHVEIEWIQAEELEHGDAGVDARLGELDGMVIASGFGERGIEGKIQAARYGRENLVPTLGICLGLQCMIIDFSRHVAGLAGANSTEVDEHTAHPVIDLMEAQQDVTDKGGTMRLGTYPARLEPDSQIAAIYGDTVVYERHRHRWEVNNGYRTPLEQAGLRFSGVSPDGRLVEFAELPSHPFWVGTQAHPEFKSRPNRAGPLFAALVEAALARAEARNPRLLPVDS